MYSTREDAVKFVCSLINSATSPFSKKKAKNQDDYSNALKTISLFGISAEELSEAGLSYENLKALGSLID